MQQRYRSEGNRAGKMVRSEKLFLIIAVTGVTIIAMGICAKGETLIEYTDDFSDWTLHREATLPGWEFPPDDWFQCTNTTSLAYDLTVNVGTAGCDRWNRFEIIAPEGQLISQIEFDWRFHNDNCNSRLSFYLIDGYGSPLNDNILWTATSTGGDPIPWNLNEVVSGFDVHRLNFVYMQHLGENLYGKVGLFAAPHDDWDAQVDNVTLTAYENLSCTPAISAQLPGDVNGDCFVNMADLYELAENWLVCSHSDPELCNPD